MKDPEPAARRATAAVAGVAFVVATAAVAAGGEPALVGPAGAAPAEPPVTAADRDHWAFRPLAEVEPPTVDGAGDVSHPVDRFLLARLEDVGLGFAPEADRRTLARRLSFDLTGLPPDPAVVEAFVADESPDAWERLVDRFLGSPHHGEHWAQHWLDLARYAESDGFEFDHERKEAWRFRDWVVDALNADLPWDRFVQWQLAGDELAPEDEGARAATGFLVAGPDMIDINLPEERRHNVLNEMASTVGAVFLGLSLECAQCHDHKSDPISLHDFYRFRAFFANTVVAPRKQTQLPRVVREPGPEPPASRVLLRGDFRTPGESVRPAYPRVLNEAGTPVPTAARDASSSGRRAELAAWITRPDQALALRVAVNRLWQHHFGAPLVATPNDFGRNGARPTHPELLDWLAAELPRRGWSLKAMHRLLVTSRAYRQASFGGPADEAWARARRADPGNRLLSRMNRRRLTGEELRDAMLAASGRLDPKRGGPGVRPPLPPEITATLLRNQWEVTGDPSEHDRRSLYLFVRRNLRFPMFDAFDRPDPNASCARRAVSTTAPQALTLLNSAFSRGMAESLAKRVMADAGPDPGARIDRAFRFVVSRPPTDRERVEASGFLETHEVLLRSEGAEDPEAAAMADFCLALLNANAAVYVD